MNEYVKELMKNEEYLNGHSYIYKNRLHLCDNRINISLDTKLFPVEYLDHFSLMVNSGECLVEKASQEYFPSKQGKLTITKWMRAVDRGDLLAYGSKKKHFYSYKDIDGIDVGEIINVHYLGRLPENATVKIQFFDDQDVVYFDVPDLDIFGVIAKMKYMVDEDKSSLESLRELI